MIPDFWTARVEAYLAKILGLDDELPVPQSSADFFLAKIAGMNVELPAPKPGWEIFLAKIAGMDVELPAPRTRAELYLAAVAGETVETPVPQTRLDEYLAAWAENSGEVTIGPSPIVSFTAKSAAPVESLIVNIEPVQSGSGDPSPDNVRALNGWPYTGYTAFSVFKTGKNMFIPIWLAKSGKYVNIYGSHTVSTSDYYKKSRGVYLDAGKTYRVYCDPGLDSAKTWGIYAIRTGSSTQITVAGSTSRTEPVNVIYTPNYSGYYLFWLYASAESTVTAIDLNDFVFYIAEGSGAYDAANASVGERIAIANTDPPGTVYAGTLDVLTGVLKVRPYYDSYNGEALVGPWVSSMDVYSPDATPTTGAQVVDLGGTETEYQLSPTEISALEGVNHIWSACGPVTVTVKGATPL